MTRAARRSGVFVGLACAAFVAAVVGIGLFVTLVVVPWAGLADQPIVGPTPEQVRERCAPIVEWIEAERLSLGRYPQRLPDELQVILDDLPYSSRYSPPTNFGVGGRGYDFCSVSIGLHSGDWPSPIYSHVWSPNRDGTAGWSWMCDFPMSDAEIRAVLEDHGYYN